jgi:hypothetical protein
VNDNRVARACHVDGGEVAMKTLIILIVAIGFGALAWLMLVVSDRLLGDKSDRRPKQPAEKGERHKTERSKPTHREDFGRLY